MSVNDIQYAEWVPTAMQSVVTTWTKRLIRIADDASLTGVAVIGLHLADASLHTAEPRFAIQDPHIDTYKKNVVTGILPQVCIYLISCSCATPLTYVRITNYETATYFVKKPRPDESHLDFSSGHFGMEVKELDMLVFNQKVAHGQHRIHDNAHCWTFFVSLVEIDDLD